MPPSAQDTAAPASTTTDARAKREAGKKALADMLAPIRSRLLLGRILAFCSALLAIAPYLALTRIGDLLLSRADATAAVWREVTILTVAFTAQIVLYFLALAVTHFADLTLSSHLRETITDRIARARLSYFTDSTAGAVRKAIQDDTKTLHVLIAHKPVEVIAAIVTPLTLLGYAFWIDWRLGLLSIATLPVYASVYVIMLSSMGTKTAEMDSKLAQVSATAVEFAEGIQVVKSFGRTGQAHTRFATAVTAFQDMYWQWVGPMMKGSSLAMAFISVPIVLAVNLGGGALMVAAGWVTIPQMLVCSLIALVLPAALETFATATWSYQLAGNSALRLQEILRTEELAHGTTTLAARQAGQGRTVTFEAVSASYHSGDTRLQALHEVSLTIPAGTTCAVIGASGSGKSTLATMLARFRDPDTGRVLIDGVDIRELSQAELYRLVAFVLQDAQVLRISIRDNIRLARPTADDEAVRQAAAAAQILADIEALPAGLDTIVDEDTGLSGGQRQRLVIARALLADTPILILDEATAATDPDCEWEIQTALNRLIRGRTVLVIAHHIESIRGVDQIAILVNGRLAACASPADLSNHPYLRQLTKDRTRV